MSVISDLPIIEISYRTYDKSGGNATLSLLAKWLNYHLNNGTEPCKYLKIEVWCQSSSKPRKGFENLYEKFHLEIRSLEKNRIIKDNEGLVLRFNALLYSDNEIAKDLQILSVKMFNVILRKIEFTISGLDNIKSSHNNVRLIGEKISKLADDAPKKLSDLIDLYIKFYSYK